MSFLAEKTQRQRCSAATESVDTQRGISGRQLGGFALLLGFGVAWLLCSAACSGAEADVLLLRPKAELGDPATGADGGDSTWPPPLPPPHCVMRFQGDSQTCQSADTWRLSASFDCESQAGPVSSTGTMPPGPLPPPMTTVTSLHLGAMEVFGLCAPGTSLDLYLGIRYLCCPDLNAPTRIGVKVGVGGGTPAAGQGSDMNDALNVSAASRRSAMNGSQQQ